MTLAGMTILTLLIVMSGAFLLLGVEYRRLHIKHRNLIVGIQDILRRPNGRQSWRRSLLELRCDND